MTGALEYFMQVLLVVYLLVRDVLFFSLNFVTELVNAFSLFVSSLL